MDAQRRQVLDAAQEVLTEDGYAGCTMSAVATRAGVATGSLYRHFANKSALAVELFRTAVGREVAAFTAAATRDTTATERVVAAVQTFADRALKSPRLAYALLAEPVDAAVDEQRLVFRTTFRDVLAAQIADGVGNGELPPQDPNLSAAAVIGAAAEALLGPLVDADPDPATVPSLITFTARALGAQHADT